MAENDEKLVVRVDLNEQMKQILAKAQEKGVEHSFMFTTTFARYKEHLKHLESLKKIIDKDGPTVTKEYVKGRGNVYVHPAINAYNSCAAAADKTAQLLLKCIIQPLSGGGEIGDDFDNF